MLTREQFIKANYQQALDATKGSKIFPETLLAMAIVESQGRGQDGNWYPGLGLVAREANNYFGIKASAAWKGKTIPLPTPGDADKVSLFRVYNSFEDSLKDFVNFLKSNPRYTRAGVFQSPDYPTQIINIARAGYAENPNYSTLITSVANKVKKLMADYIEPIKSNGKILPLLVTGLIITGYFIVKKMQTI
jgi:flagellum-specific peptidoglycan hydrolase FlgJ